MSFFFLDRENLMASVSRFPFDFPVRGFDLLQGTVPHTAFVIRIRIKDSSYPVWRLVHVDADGTLADLQRILIKVIGWSFKYPYYLRIDETKYTLPEFNIKHTLNANNYKISKYLQLKKIYSLV